MTDTDHLPPRPLSPDTSASRHAHRGRLVVRQCGLSLTLAGDILVIASLFSPWLDVYKVYPVVPRQGYSPWTVLQRGTVDALGVVIGIFFLLTAGIVLSSLVLARSRTADARSLAASMAVVLALAGMVMVSVSLASIPAGLALSYPYYDTTIEFGGGLAIGGFASVIVGVGIAGIAGLRRQ